ncbi:MAG: hypothetical protein IPJ85_12080 [Flavobacteriales bacterium]|nr:hypothetical protein [Flavobacteriales bacterium]
MKGRRGFTLKIADNLSGIGSWRGTLNGEWILMEYDPEDQDPCSQLRQAQQGTGQERVQAHGNR